MFPLYELIEVLDRLDELVLFGGSYKDFI